MKIDGYYVPDELVDSAQVRADQLGTPQHIGVVYDKERTIKLSDPTVQYFRDLSIGRFCTWVFGPTYAELKGIDRLAVILWISPRRAA